MHNCVQSISYSTVREGDEGDVGHRS
jgi:hypothetical protein